ncbi:kinase-like protein [Rhizopogon vinicolor AM-OR11-026]|uniref:non-specific serine/threonine protein kinase n=1 Tax=Rhizopogon vinicolor AM-OR11-026 TaxID=1314800 RepID=A0A1B7NFE9_9AGAM|nr:kinase-like protein [Rhizopogon vinicolor AM-OR11-026]
MEMFVICLSYLLFLLMRDQVSIAMEQFDLTEPDNAVAFLREMYNLAAELKSFTNKFNKNKRTKLRAIQLAASGVTSLHTRTMQPREQSSSSSSSSSDNDDDGGGGGGGGGDGGEDDLGVFCADEIRVMLKALKWKIDCILFGHPHIAVVSHVSHAWTGFLKFVRRGQKEVEILQYLLGIDSPSNHTIAGVAIWPVHGGNVISMPAAGLWLTSLTKPNAYMWSVAKQLLEAVDFMHQHGVAHMDLKPENILVSPDGRRLSIIDFSTSIRVKGVEDMFSGIVGTVGYIPPEVAAGHHYSPIRADLWSCGKTLRELCERCRPSSPRDALLDIARQLMSEDPDKRPMMSEIFAHVAKSGSFGPLIIPQRAAHV